MAILLAGEMGPSASSARSNSEAVGTWGLVAAPCLRVRAIRGFGPSGTRFTIHSSRFRLSSSSTDRLTSRTTSDRVLPRNESTWG